MKEIILLLVSSIVSSFATYPIELWRIRRQIYPIIKRFNTYYYALLGAGKDTTNVDNSDDKYRKQHRPEECFIDEFGWSIFIRGVTIEILQSFATYIIIYMFVGDLLWKSQAPNTDTPTVPLLSMKSVNIRGILAVLVQGMSVGLAVSFVSHKCQTLKIRLQFTNDDDHRNRKINDTFSPSPSNNSNNTQQPTVMYRANIIEVGIKQIFGDIIPRQMYTTFKQQTMVVVIECLFYVILIPSFYLFRNLQQIYLHPSVRSNVLPTSNFTSLFIDHIINYILYKSPFLPLTLSLLLSILITQGLCVFQTQLQTFDYAFHHLQTLLINKVSSIDQEKLVTFPKKFTDLYSKSEWAGFTARLLYFPLRFLILTAWFDFLIGVI